MKHHQQSITFIVTEDEVDGGFTAHAHWPDGNREIFTQGEDREDLIRNIREAVEVSFEDAAHKPKLIHLHFVRDETLPVSGDSAAARYPLRGRPYRFDDPQRPVGAEEGDASPKDQQVRQA